MRPRPARRCAPCRRRRRSPFALILEAHRRAAAAGVADLTDDVAVAEWAGAPAYVFEGDPANVKVTTMQDFSAAEARLTASASETRVGQGFDVHAFAPGDHVWLCGVTVPHAQALSGHSDADVALHALADAIYGALAEGDIGAHFPPSDPQWKGAASKVFLAHAAGRVRARGGVIVNLDATLICEAPKIGPHREAMRARVAEIAGLDIAPRRRQGDDDRAARLRRPRRGHRVPGDGDGAVAVSCDGVGEDSPRKPCDSKEPLDLPIPWTFSTLAAARPGRGKKSAKRKKRQGEDRMADYVIVGAGSAGCVLAARLSENPAAEVTLIEAGGPDSAQEIHIPLSSLNSANRIRLGLHEPPRARASMAGSFICLAEKPWAARARSTR